MMNDTTTKRLKPVMVTPRVTIRQNNYMVGVLLQVVLLLAALMGYLFCNVTALDVGISPLITVLIGLGSFGLMVLLVWYKRVFFGVLGGLAGVSLLAFPISFPLFRQLGRSIVVCYNYIIYLLGSQPDYSSYMAYMTMDLDGLLRNPEILTRHMYTAMVIVSLLASLGFALALFRRIPMLCGFIVPLIGLVPYFFYGIVPNYIAFSVFLAAVIGCYSQSVVQQIARRRERAARKETNIRTKKGKKKKRKNPQTTEQRLAFSATFGHFGVIVTAIMLIVALLTASFIYSRPILQLERVRETIDNMADDAMNNIFRSTYEKNLNVAGYMEQGELLGMNVPSWRRLWVATLSSRTSTPVYLRYRTTVDFTEDGWTVGDEDFDEEMDNALGLEFCEATQFYNYMNIVNGVAPADAKLDHIDSEEKGYVLDHVTVYPHYKVSNMLGLPKGISNIEPNSYYDDLEYQADTMLLHHDHPDNRSYLYTVASPVLTSAVFLTNFDEQQKQYLILRNQNMDDPYLYREKDYSTFVASHYLDLPEYVEGFVGNLAEEITAPYKTKLEKVQAIERYFRTNYKYSTTRQKLSREDGTPANAYDYIYYFLIQNEKKEGYCTLFATSMVSMLRSLGYPARVATGYYAEPMLIDTDNYATELADSNYHAWVEVYFDGMGWVNFEPTPDFGVEPNYYLLELVDENKKNEIEVDVEIVYVEIEGFVKYTNDLPDPTGKEEKEEDDVRDVIASALELNSMRGVARMILRILLIVLLIFLLLFLTEFWHRRSLRRVKAANASVGVRNGYYLILRLMQLQGFKFFEGELLEDYARRVDNLKLAPLPMSELVEILQKAIYSDAPISEEERAKVVEFVYALDKAVFLRVNPIKALWFKITLSKKPRYKGMIWSFS